MCSRIISQQFVILQMGEFLSWLTDGLLKGEQRGMLLLEIFFLLVDELVLVLIVDVWVLFGLLLLFLDVVAVRIQLGAINWGLGCLWDWFILQLLQCCLHSDGLT